MGLVGETHPVSQKAIAEATKGLTWAIQLDDKWYEAEFTGLLDENDQLLVNIKRSTKAPAGHRA